MPDEHRLRPKYGVSRLSEDGKAVGVPLLSTNPEDVDSPFVLAPRKDPAAFAAMVAYARMCEPSLANEIKAWLRKIVVAPVVYGTQGERNLKAVRLKALNDIISFGD